MVRVCSKKVLRFVFRLPAQAAQYRGDNMRKLVRMVMLFIDKVAATKLSSTVRPPHRLRDLLLLLLKASELIA